jgi:hypothetical protein
MFDNLSDKLDKAFLKGHGKTEVNVAETLKKFDARYRCEFQLPRILPIEKKALDRTFYHTNQDSYW